LFRIQFEFTTHAENMLHERNINREWVQRTIFEPVKTETKEDGSTHYLKPISEREDRILRVVTIKDNHSLRIITVFFDRRIRSTK
jgi:hypothetical protein